MAKVKICYASFGTDSQKVNAVSLRGYMGYLFADDREFHHHSESSHHYPKIQYKKIDQELIIMGLAEYADVIFEKISQVDHVTTESKKLPVHNLILETKIFNIVQESSKYCFVTPWLGLNEKNYEKYIMLNTKDKVTFLEKILVGNILSMLKGLGIRIDFKIEVKILKFRSKTVLAHNNRFAGFFSEWDSNISLPENCGLGKSVSKGFGIVKKRDVN